MCMGMRHLTTRSPKACRCLTPQHTTRSKPRVIVSMSLPRRLLGNTGLEVSVLGYGASPLGSVFQVGQSRAGWGRAAASMPETKQQAVEVECRSPYGKQCMLACRTGSNSSLQEQLQRRQAGSNRSSQHALYSLCPAMHAAAHIESSSLTLCLTSCSTTTTAWTVSPPPLLTHPCTLKWYKA
jgi:hypothetical protein